MVSSLTTLSLSHLKMLTSPGRRVYRLQGGTEKNALQGASQNPSYSFVLKKILTDDQAPDTKVLFDFSNPQEYADIK